MLFSHVNYLTHFKQTKRMKKLFFSFAIVAAVVLSACNSKTEEAPATEEVATEAPATEAPAAEAAVVDTTAAAAPAATEAPAAK